LTKIIIGTLPFGSVLSEIESASIIRCAWENDYRAFDVATLYGNGSAAEILARSLGDWKSASEIWVSIGLERVPDPKGVFSVKVQKLTPGYIRESIDEMLRRLEIEKISVLNIHGPDPSTPFEETLEELLRLKDSGKIGKVAISNFTPTELEILLAVDKQFGGGLDIFQMHGNMLEQRLINEFKNLLKESGKEIFCYRPLARGLLTRNYSRKNPKPIYSRSTRGWRLDSYLTEDLLEQLEILDDLISDFQYNPIHVSLYWLLSESGVNGAITGIRTLEQMKDLVSFSSFIPSIDFKIQLEKFMANPIFSNYSGMLPRDYFEK
jgi:L-glyceraldehyde 3-phosphate reductase